MNPDACVGGRAAAMRLSARCDATPTQAATPGAESAVYDCLVGAGVVFSLQEGTTVMRRRRGVRRHDLARPTRPPAPSYPAERRSSSSTRDSHRSVSTSSAARLLFSYVPSLIASTSGTSCSTEPMKLRFSPSFVAHND